MEKYTIKYTHWESSLEETGDDLVNFFFEITPEKESCFIMIMQYRTFKNLLEQKHPDIFKLLEKARQSCSKWGPNESVYIKELEEYGIDISKLLVPMALDCYDIEAEIERNRALIANPPNYEEILDEMEAPITNLKRANTIYKHLCEELEKTLSDRIVELYPVLINSSSENIRKLEDILISNTTKLADQLNGLIIEAEDESE